MADIIGSLKNTQNIIVDAANTISATADKIEGAINGLSDLGSTLKSASATVETIAAALGSSAYTGGPIENMLSKFASFTYKFTFGPLTVTETNFPDSTYRKNGPSVIVLESGGTGNDQVKTTLESTHGITTEYFIDDVEIETLMSPNGKTKHTNATSINFTVHEPYSMGMFLQTLQIAAKKAGHKNYTKAPFLLQVEFLGWDDDGKLTNLTKAKRMFPLTLNNIEFSVSEGGSVYHVDAIGWHEQAFADETQNIMTDLDLEGETLIEMLQTGSNSLASQLNSRQLELEQSGNKVTGDQYVILFPKIRSTADEQLLGATEGGGGANTQSGKGEIRQLTEEQKKDIYQSLTGIADGELPADFDTELEKLLGIVVTRSALGETVREFAEDEANSNKIGLSKIAKSYLDSGKTYFGKPGFVQDEENTGVFKRGDIVISNEAKKIQFPKGAKIQDIIEELVLISEYGRQFITEEPDSVGMKKWFKIEADCYLVKDTKNVEQTGDSPKVFVYRVVPYGIQSSTIAGPTQVPPGYKNLVKQALKEYNYIYTGKNDDIIKFDIDINTAFFNALMGDYGQQHADAVSGGRDKSVKGNEPFTGGAPEGRSDVSSSSGTVTSKETTKASSGGLGYGAETHPETQIARSFNDAIVNSNTDLVSVDLEIWGDPYYIADSGQGNYNASELSGVLNMTADGSMEYQTSEVDIVINFRTPLDIGTDGYMIFPEVKSTPVGAFSGLYKVVSAQNKFAQGRFTQTLSTIRRRNQESDTGGAQPAVNSSSIIEKPGAVISPVIDQSIADYIPPEVQTAVASLNQLGGILSGIQSDISGALSGLNGQLNAGINGLVSNLSSGKLPTNLLSAAKDAANSAQTALNNATSALNNLKL